MREISKDELLSAPPATHHIKSWSGIVDPKAPIEQSVAAVMSIREKGPHEPQYHFFGCFEGTYDLVDVGANCGQSLVAFKTVSAAPRTISFEPNPFSFEIARNVARNFDQCEVHNFGLGDAEARLAIYTPVIDGLLVTPLTSLDRNAFDPGGAMHKFTTENIAKGAEVSLYRQEIELRRGDDLGLAPDALKVDVEGAEMSVLRGLTSTIARHKPIVMIEKSEFVAVSQFFAGLGYAPYRYDEQKQVGDHALQRLVITQTTNTNVVPVNMFYLHEEKLSYYAGELGVTFF